MISGYFTHMRKVTFKAYIHRAKSCIFGQTAKFGQRLCLFHISNIGIKNKLTKQTVEILMRREPSHLDLHCLQMCVRIYLMSEFTRLYPSGIRDLIYPELSYLVYANSLC